MPSRAEAEFVTPSVAAAMVAATSANRFIDFPPVALE
jgi:hypothetical protein